ncbi:MAG: cyclic lactone autoinducer peptide [Lachnospiraceae bacterium]|nr:cyclic lactone autoinducer peptide [Lachnospiraceae bacterium]
MTRIKVEADSYRWPPLCTGILHQPKRPMQKKHK